jgi:hypothetical protein
MSEKPLLCMECVHSREPLIMGGAGIPPTTPEGLNAAVEWLKKRETQKRQEEQFHSSNPDLDMPKEPVFYRWCAKLSTRGGGNSISEWALCRVRNRNGDCAHFFKKHG